MKAWPSALFTAAALLIAPLALTACDQKTDTKETKVIKEPAPTPAPVINETRINETKINESRINETNIVNAPTTVIEKKH